MPHTRMMFALALTTCGLTLPVHAETASEAAAQAPHSYDFEDELVAGDLVSPFGELLSVRRRGQRASLIEVRASYVDKLVRSVEDL